MASKEVVWTGFSIGVVGLGLGSAGLGMAVDNKSNINSLDSKIQGLIETSVNLLDASVKLKLSLDKKVSVSDNSSYPTVNGIASITSENTVTTNKVTCQEGKLGEIDGSQFVVTDIKTNIGETYLVTGNSVHRLNTVNIKKIIFQVDSISTGTRVTIINETESDIASGDIQGVKGTATDIPSNKARDYILIDSLWVEVV